MHAGACLAVTLNERLDYFGQTVNIAARVHALADAGEIVITEEVLAAQGASALLDGRRVASEEVRLRGVAGDLRVYRIGGSARSPDA